MTEVITSKQNELVKLAISLKQRKYRQRYGLFLLEGHRTVTEALEAGLELETLFIGTGLENIEKLLPKFNQQKTKCRWVSEEVLKHMADTVNPQGILALGVQPRYSLPELVSNENCFLVIADGLQDPGNLGTIIRTADAAKADAILLTENTTDPFNAKAVRASMGSLFHLPVVSAKTEEVIAFCRDNEAKLVVGDIGAQDLCFQVDLTGKVALAVGNENIGPGDLLRAAADEQVRIPMPGRAQSLNAAVAAGILIYEVVRQRL